jgi:pyruvate carboxylase
MPMDPQDLLLLGRVRRQYAAFESDLKAPASEVYLHEMPGGQFTNLKEQARSLGLANRWHEVAPSLCTTST